MKYASRIIAFILCIILTAGVLSACAGSSGTQSKNTTADASGTPQETAEESVRIPDTSDSTVITLSGESAAVSGSGAETGNGTVTITDGGTYLITGELSEGRILVNAPEKEVTIVLENAGIRCTYGSPIYIYQSRLTTLCLAEGTTNTLTDGSEYTFSDSFSSSVDEEPNACLYSKSDLVIAGSGRLIVNANYKNGITSKDTLKIEAASIAVTAKNHGINGKDSCVIQNAAIQVTSGGDALRSTNDSDAALGYIAITDSSLNLTAGEDGVQAETSLTISGGTCNVTSGGGSGGSVASDTSAKGLKGGTSVTLKGGEYTLDCYDDAIHANGNVLISGGTYAITTADDGINAAGGMDQSGFGPRQDHFASSSNSYINISGGIITVDASGDGVDANGSIMVSGGELYISGPTDSGNGAFDYGGTATITGGIVVAAGSSGMAQNFGNSSTQGSILLAFPAYSTETITLKDASGNTLVSYSPGKRYNCVVISCPSITTGNTYTVEAGGQTSSVTMSSLIYGDSGGMGGPGGMGGGPGGMGGPGGRP